MSKDLTFTWRIERSMRDWLREEAKRNGRSMNSELSKIVNQVREESEEKEV